MNRTLTLCLLLAACGDSLTIEGADPSPPPPAERPRIGLVAADRNAGKPDAMADGRAISVDAGAPTADSGPSLDASGNGGPDAQADSGPSDTELDAGSPDAGPQDSGPPPEPVCVTTAISGEAFCAGDCIGSCLGYYCPLNDAGTACNGPCIARCENGDDCPGRCSGQCRVCS